MQFACLVILAAVLLANSSVDAACDPKYAKNKNHVMCQPETCFGGIERKTRGLSDIKKLAILDAYNRMRSAVARGIIPAYPPATNMKELRWSDELEKSGKYPMLHTKLPEFPVSFEVPDDFAIFLLNGAFTYYGSPDKINQRSIRNKEDQYPSPVYTVIGADAEYLACGATKYTSHTKSKQIVSNIIMACIIAPGPLMGEGKPFYEFGEPACDVPSSHYKGLCSTKELNKMESKRLPCHDAEFAKRPNNSIYCADDQRFYDAIYQGIPYPYQRCDVSSFKSRTQMFWRLTALLYTPLIPILLYKEIAPGNSRPTRAVHTQLKTQFLNDEFVPPSTGIYESKTHPFPYTLTWLPSISSSESPKLNPYPSWKFQIKGNCKTMQQIKGMVVDVCGRLWAVDNGNETCPAKLWIFDLTEGDSLSLVHQFSDEIVNHAYSSRELNSLVLDERPNDTLAYIHDYETGNLIGFSLKENVSWTIEIQDIHVRCIALSPIKGKEVVYLGSQEEAELYSVPLSQLRMRGGDTPLTLTLVGDQKAGSSRMLMDNKGKLYFDLETFNYVGTWDTNTNSIKEEELYKDERLTYYDFKFNFAFDTCNNLWIMSKDNTKPTNFRLVRAAVGAKSYLYNDLITPKGCGRIPPSYLTKKYELTTVKPSKLPQTSNTVPFKVSKTNIQTTIVTPTEKPKPKKETPSLLWGLFDVDSIEKSNLIIALICLVVSSKVSCCIILWLAIWVNGLRKTIKGSETETEEMSVIPAENAVQRDDLEEEIYDDVGPPIASTSGPAGFGNSRPNYNSEYSDIYDEVVPSPAGSEIYINVQSLGGQF
ncbi:Hypothetical predicted protein [Cloeon dipterum]|uniref:Bee-milk protein n=1 Tax=Cloeon dipterum TaxID=197152 RepID=A0A8S1DUL5_9INSE|nr:Hypothetical predicted protein [Cloeon dipterum]